MIARPQSSTYPAQQPSRPRSRSCTANRFYGFLGAIFAMQPERQIGGLRDRFLTLAPLLFGALILSGCATKGSITDGAGYARLTMQAPTRTFIVANDPGFVGQVVAHNQQCAADKLCAK